MDNPLKALGKFGQSPWYDMISRKMLDSGLFERLIREDGLRGVTSNPTIFDSVISGSSDYDAALREALAEGLREPKALFERLAIRDIQDACDALRPVYDESGGADGFVSLEVSPKLSHDAEGTVAEGVRLFAAVGRPNAMIKVPATAAGLPAIASLIASAVNVNVTLIFSIARYREVMEAYLAGLERRAGGGDLAGTASVASFFVSRIDSAADKELDVKAPGSPLRGRTAIANAKLAYQAYKKVFTTSRFNSLGARGARAQRPLWASTSMKDPAYRDVLYVEELIGPGTVNTIPPATWDAFRDHGKVRASLDEGVAEAEQTLSRLAQAGVDLDAITLALERAGVESFAKSFDSLLSNIERKSLALAPRRKIGRPQTAAK